mmetsp:Transcript_6179/g.9994  ORF Transcript_6179/g.9994 Transcript_6179/m.9994 type:complete len:80 (-) Transcript_6179:1800-2039(-)
MAEVHMHVMSHFCETIENKNAPHPMAGQGHRQKKKKKNPTHYSASGYDNYPPSPFVDDQNDLTKILDNNNDIAPLSDDE